MTVWFENMIPDPEVVKLWEKEFNKLPKKTKEFIKKCAKIAEKHFRKDAKQ